VAHAASGVFRRAAFSKWRRHSRGHVLVESASGCHDGGHKADAVTWFDNGSWITSSAYGSMPFIEDFVKAHAMKVDYRQDLGTLAAEKRLFL